MEAANKGKLLFVICSSHYFPRAFLFEGGRYEDWKLFLLLTWHTLFVSVWRLWSNWTSSLYQIANRSAARLYLTMCRTAPLSISGSSERIPYVPAPPSNNPLMLSILIRTRPEFAIIYLLVVHFLSPIRHFPPTTTPTQSFTSLIWKYSWDALLYGAPFQLIWRLNLNTPEMFFSLFVPLLCLVTTERASQPRWPTTPMKKTCNCRLEFW